MRWQSVFAFSFDGRGSVCGLGRPALRQRRYEQDIPLFQIGCFPELNDNKKNKGFDVVSNWWFTDRKGRSCDLGKLFSKPAEEPAEIWSLGDGGASQL